MEQANLLETNVLAIMKSKENELGKFVSSFEESELGRRYFDSRELIEETFHEFHARGTILTIRNDNAPVGYMCYLPKGAFHSFPYLHILTVIPEYRGHGFGGEALNQFEIKYAKPASKVFLVVADFNPSAKKFYERHGYRVVGRIPHLYRSDIDEFLMMKDLS